MEDTNYVINVSDHAKLRYTQRYKNITNECDALQYIASNDDMITDNIRKFYAHSKFLFRGRMKNDLNQEVRQYFTNDDMLLIVNDKKTVVVTLIQIDFGFGQKINRQLIKSILKQIDLAQTSYDRRKNTIDKLTKSKQKSILRYSAIIKNLQSKILFYQNKLDLVKDFVKSRYKELNIYESQISYYTDKIINSNNVRKEMDLLLKNKLK